MFALAAVHVDFAFLCDFAGGTSDGKLEASGIGVDTFTAPHLPARLPLLLAARLSCSEAPRRLWASVLDADARPVLTQDLPFEARDREDGQLTKLPVLAHLFVPLREAGDYRIDLVADASIVQSIAFTVRGQPI